VTTVLVTLGVLLAAVLLAPRLSTRLRVVALLAVVAVPVLWMLPGTLRRESDRIDRYFALTPVEAEVAPPFWYPGYANVPLLLGIRKHVPRDATISFFPADMPRRTYLQTGWVRWLAFVIAPRLVSERADAPWAVLVDQTPAEAGLRSRAAWRFGRDWLVRR
jgi:hypothetical protein